MASSSQVECFPPLLQVKKPKEVFQLAAMFVLGVACIGIAVNTSHEHCEVTAATAAVGTVTVDPHAGHGGH